MAANTGTQNSHPLDKTRLYGLKRFHQSGFTLTEMLVALVILSILAGVAIPFAEVGYRRAKEAELRQSLRSIREAIDRFHKDCEEKIISPNQQGVSRDCYPLELSVLVEGVETGEGDGSLKYYLRRIPGDPFVNEEDSSPETHWEIRGYRDSPDGAWRGEDVFDIRVENDLQALNGTDYVDW